MRRYEDWSREAACKGKISLFFLEQGGKSNKAKAICSRCPVRLDCLSYAIMYDEEGIWGGMTDEERKKLPKELKEQLIVDAKKQGLYRERPTAEYYFQLFRERERELMTALQEVARPELIFDEPLIPQQMFPVHAEFIL